MPVPNKRQKCSICGENESLIFVKVMNENMMEEKGLCAPCAIHYMEHKGDPQQLDFVDKRVVDALEEMKGLLSAIVSNISAISTLVKTKKDSLECGNCGMTYEKFRSSGYFGCAYCYEIFKEDIKDFILEIERGSVHKGRMPAKFAKLYLLKKEVKYLKNRLKKSLFNENYEEADRLKRRLERLIGSYPVGKEDEIY